MSVLKPFKDRVVRLAMLLAIVIVLDGPDFCMGSVKPATIETAFLKWVICQDGSNLAFVDKRSGVDYCDHKQPGKFARLRTGGKEYAVSEVIQSDGKLKARFGESGVTVLIGIVRERKYFALEVLSVSDPGVEELVILDISLNCQGALSDPFQACALALNIKADINEIPGPGRHLLASCFARPGIVGAKVGVLGCPAGELRNAMKECVRSAKDLPQTDRGGPWALDAAINRGSYLIDYPGSISESNVDKWIAAARGIGAKQIDFHTGHTLRFGDYEPDPKLYPRGLASLKSVIDKLHAAGIAAGLHTYAFYVSKESRWVTPVPDRRLAEEETFSLATPITEADRTVTVTEDTSRISTIVGFQVRNSVTLRIDDELITYTGASKAAPYTFTGCERGVHSTKLARHEAGAKAHHLKECFGLFTPDGDSTMFNEVADRTAEVCNSCGFDMIYLDALDGADVLGRWPNGWKYYSNRFVDRIVQGLERPVIMEMSTFSHHLWFTRSRVGAWDAPSKGYKRFIDQHFLENRDGQHNLLPSNLGWWCIFDGTLKERDRTFPDGLEYIMCKALAGDHSLSWLMGFDPESFATSGNARRLGAIVRQYEELRLANYFPPSTLEKLAAPESDFTLEATGDAKWQLRPVNYDSHKVSAVDGVNNRWKLENKYHSQPLNVRIEALLSLAPYESGAEVLGMFGSTNEFSQSQSAQGMAVSLRNVTSPVRVGASSGWFSAKSSRTNATCAWGMVGKAFPQPVNLLEKGFGLWIHGDAKGEVLNFQWRAPEHLSGGLSEHYAVVDFAGWRYFEFVEAESDRLVDYGWPYLYADPDKDFASPDRIKKFNRFTGTSWVDYGKLDSLKIWCNNIPEGEEVSCYLSPVKALPHVKSKLHNPAIKVGGRSISFPTTLESGHYLEFRSPADCKVFDARGELICEIKPVGDVPEIETGINTVEFTCDTPQGVSARANVTMISKAPFVLPGSPKKSLAKTGTRNAKKVTHD